MASKRSRKRYKSRRVEERTNSLRSSSLSLTNPVSGMGGISDKAAFNQFNLMRRPPQQELDNLYYQSWAARKLVDLPVDDMLRRWREWNSENLKMASAVSEVEERFEVRSLFVRTAKAARLYGSALLVLVDRQEDMNLPLNTSTWRPGRLSSLRSVGGYAYSIPRIDRNFLSPTYGMPEHYLLHEHYGAPLKVHPSRVLRLWGVEPLSEYFSWHVGIRYGISVLQPVLATIFEDEAIVASAAHLVQETSIPILQIPGLREALAAAGPVDFDSVDASEYMNTLNANKGIYRTLLLDQDEEFKRVDVSWTGLPDLMDRMSNRLAAAADIPTTRFEGRSPAGMNATGDSDMDNYVLMLEAERLRQWGGGKLRLLDEVLVAEAGFSLESDLTYKWPPLRLVNPKEETQMVIQQVEAVVKALDYNLIDEEEARDLLTKQGFFSSLSKQDV